MTEREKSVEERAAIAYARTVFTRADLIATGMVGRDITAAVRSGRLRRLRRDRYVPAETSTEVSEAVRIGGRLSCLSLLKSIGVFVHRCEGLHVFVIPGTSRIREPKSETTKVHWAAWSRERAPLHAAPLADAVRQSIRCQTPRAALATLDSLLHHEVMTREELERVILGLPSRFHPLMRLVDPSAASGPETYMRLILRALGVSFETQVWLPDVGYVDFLVDGWLIIECDSKEFHEGWKKQVKDRRRDLAAAQQGYVTVRPLAAEILDDHGTIREKLQRVIDALGAKLTS